MQRALFARAMLQDAQLILLDEPFNAVDERTVTDLLVLIKAWVAEGARCLPSCMTISWCGSIFPRPCSSRGVSWALVRQPMS